jgi:hypothetical protein
MSRRLAVPIAVAVVFACGEGTSPAPIEWTPALDVATAALSDPLVAEAVGGLHSPAPRESVAALIGQARLLAEAHDAGAAAERVAAARQALVGGTDGEFGLFIAVLELVLTDTEERFRQALVT